MRIILFGATGMVGQGALRECLLIQPLHGIVSRTTMLRVLYAVVGPL